MGKREKVYLKDTAIWDSIDHSASEEQFPETYARLDTLTHGSGLKLVWKCSENHSWSAQVRARIKGHGCPYCSGRMATDSNRLSICSPGVSSEWDYGKNGTASPEDVTVGSKHKFWWVCSEGHQWQASVVSRTNGNGCPFCSGRRATDTNRLSINNPELAREWDFDKNELTPYDVSVASNKKIWWACAEQHSWRAQIKSRSRGHGCPTCAKRFGKIEKRFIETFTEQTELTLTAHGMRLNQLTYASGRSGVEVDIILYRNGYYLLVEYDGNYWHRAKAELDTEKSRALLSIGDNILHARIREDELPDLDLVHDRFNQFRHAYHASESSSIEGTVRKIESWFLEKIGE